MKKIGILGGLAWPSTAEYYAGLCRLAEAAHAEAGRRGPAPMPEMTIESLDVTRAQALFGDDADDASWTGFDTYHHDGLQRLERSGADFAVIACNTAHHRLRQITRGIGIPVLSILDAAAAACDRIGVKRVLILGTLPVMDSAYFRATFAEHGIEAESPRSVGDRRKLVAAIEALSHGPSEDAANAIHAVVTGAGRTRKPALVYLGCTELPLAFPAHRQEGVFENDGIRYLNSTALHIRTAFACTNASQ